MEQKSELYIRNFQRLEKSSLSGLEDLELVENRHIEFCRSENDLLNLCKKIDGETYFFYDQSDPILEAGIWFSTLNLKNTQIIFVYGLGLGYYYKAAEEWLKEDPSRSLVFIEDDPEVINCFLDTEYAEKVLANSSVKIYFFKTLDRSLPKFDKICRNFIGLNHKVTALGLYLKQRSSELMRINNILSFLMKMHQIEHEEYKRYSIPFFLSYYLNLFTLPDSYLAKPLWGSFKNIPAIICGAGPSLAKNVELLKTLKGKALLFGGSTSMNALNAYGILPHFGVGIDPNNAQLNRIITSQAFQIPYFINFRMNSFAVNAVHGDHLYVNGAGTYDIAKWVDKELGISGPVILEGYNVINYAFSIAVALGCNPISFVGVDLAYSNGESYPKLTPEHALYKGQERFLTKTASEDLIARKDIYGESTFTLWKWLMESMWYSKSALEQKKIEIYNSTEGGIGFPGIENRTLQDFAEKELKKSYDLTGMVHSKIQMSCQMPEKVNEKSIFDILKIIRESTKNSIDLCENISNGYRALISDIANHVDYPQNLLTNEIIENVTVLNDETAYKYTLILFMHHLTEVLNKEIEKLELDKEWLSREELDQELAQIHLTRFNFIKEASEKNLMVLDNALTVSELHSTRKENFSDISQEEYPFIKIPENCFCDYHLDDGVLKIRDDFYHLKISESFELENPENCHKEYFKNGLLKSEQFYCNGELHGPSRFYSEAGQLLAESWYFHGKRTGRSKAYFASGEIYSTTGYLEDALHGPQDYYYIDGKKRSHLNYSKGELDGPLYLFFPNGQLKRELHFKKGKKDGVETLWNFEGKLIGEATYQNDIPIGKARFWNAQGKIQKEVSFDEKGHVIDTRIWDYLGREIFIPEETGKDYFDLISLKMESFTRNLSDITANLEKIVPHMGKYKAIHTLEEEIVKIKIEIDNLLNLNKKMKLETGMTEEGKEAIWKTPTMQESLQGMMEQVSNNLKHQVERVQGEFINILNNLLESEKKR